MGRKVAGDISPKKIVMSFCLDPDLAFKVKKKCNKTGLGLSVLLQEYLEKWIGKENNGKSAATPKV